MATVVFSVVLLIVTSGIIKISQSYYKGIIQNRTQETTRNISEDISRTIQLSSGQKVDGPDPTRQFCVGTVRYTFVLNEVVPADPLSVTGLRAETVPPNTCASLPNPNSTSRQLLSQNMRLLRFNVDKADPSAQTWRIDIRIAYGDNDLLSHYDNDGAPNSADPVIFAADTDGANCKSGITGGSFCATAQLNTLVKKRLKN